LKKLLCMLLLPIMLFLGGCAQKQMSREEQLVLQERTMQASVKVYEGFSVSQLAQATEKVLYLMDPADMRIRHQKSRVFSERRYSIYLVLGMIFGIDTWVIKFEELDSNKIQVSVALGVAESAGMIAVPPTPRSPEEITVEYSALCEAESKLFFERLDYFLGKTTRWQSCEGVKKWAQENNFLMTPVFDGLPFMCGHNRFSGLEDKTPEYLIK